MLHQDLWKANSDLVQQCLSHPFVTGLANGTLQPEAFRRYVAQDAFFLRSFLKSYAIAAAKCDDWMLTRKFHGLMAGVLDELELHQRYAGTLAIDLDNVTPHPSTTAYTDFLLRTAWQEDVPQILAAMVPCLRLYAFLGKELSLSATPGNPYQDWIDTYSSPGFQELCSTLEGMFDELADDSQNVRDGYRCAMHCELNFFSAHLDTVS